jgi:phosphatidylinositol-3,4,5-trisphosphate 3-phosphatase/dual-specificity protein phosphatase PTEN
MIGLRLLRGLVSQHKRRFEEDGFSLDLTYITPRIIAMGYPSADIEALYRNPLKEVVRFFETRHRGRYKVFNLCSERCYDPEHFGNSVANFPFDDHNAPPLGLIGAFCRSAEAWLALHPDNVVAVHCKAGKSRTGLMVTALLLHVGMFPEVDQAVEYYNDRRTHDGNGLNIGSQLRYVRYYHEMLRNGWALGGPPPRSTFLMMVTLLHAPPGLRGPVRFAVRTHDGGLIHSCAEGDKEGGGGGSVVREREVGSPNSTVMAFMGGATGAGVPLSGDWKLEVLDKDHVLFFVWQNTSFQVADKIVLEGRELDKFKTRHQYPQSFAVQFQFATEHPK